MTDNEVARIIGQAFFVSDDSNLNITDALLKMAVALGNIASAIDGLANADVATPMGAIEALGVVHKEGYELLAAAIGEKWEDGDWVRFSRNIQAKLTE